jgi:DNA-directed RNA polymerase specialized sigma24 family protein
MERNHHLTDAGSRVARTIRVRADRLARSGAVPGMDADDIAQDLRLDLFERAPRYDSTRASYETFADRVTANRIATLASPTARLRAERGMRDLHGPSGKGDGEGLPLADTLPESSALHAAERAEADVALGLRRDVSRLLAALPPACRQVAVALVEMSPTEAARALGLNRCTIYARLASIRAAARALGLEDYVRAPRHFATPAGK